MSKFIAGREYIAHNDSGFKMKVKSRGTKYLSGTIYVKTRSREWNPANRRWETVYKEHKHPFEKAKFNHYDYDDRDSIWFFMPEYDKRVGFVSD